ncbi:MAG TPA: serine/threonine-protein kinase [Polyangia bacterium]|nr:serine/threonine-protein kinase [Polyangia bacterium]
MADGRLPEVLGRYRLVREVGAGGMGSVYEGVDLSLDRRVAIKVINSNLGPEATERFLAEARIVARVEHPGIVQVFDFGTTPDGRPYLVMELLRGESLGHFLRRHGALPAAAAAAVAVEIARALGAAHDMGIVHRDLKPDNIHLVPEEGAPLGCRVKILDFGIAKAHHERAPYTTQAGAVLGTPVYMAPEQALDSSTVDTRTDIYALGVVLFEMLCGRPPFVSNSAMTVMLSHINDAPPDPVAFNPALPAPFAAAVLSMLAKQPAGRPETMSEVAALLAPFTATPTRLGVSSDAEREPPGLRALLEPGEKPQRAPDPTATAGAPPPLAPAFVPAPTTSGASAPRPFGPTATFGAAPMPSGGRAPAADERWRAVTATLPPSMQSAHDVVRAFLSALFGGATQAAGEVVRLSEPKLAHGEGYDFFALFITDTGALGPRAPLGHLATRVFVDRAGDLQRHLQELESQRPKVVLIIAQAGDIGAGVREIFLEYRQRYDAIIVPLYLGEIERWRREGDMLEPFEARLESHCTLPDPYAARGLSSDPTQLIGMNEEVMNVVAQIREQGGVINITGQPGCGKSALVQLAEYGCHDRRFVYLRAGDASHGDPALVAAELLRAVESESVPGTPRPAAGAAPEVGTTNLQAALEQQLKLRETPSTSMPAIRSMITTMMEPAPRAASAPKPLVLAIEDADWLIELLSAPDGEAARRAKAQALWSALAELARARQLTVIVTSVRGFELGDGVVAGWVNPVKPRPIAIKPLDRRSLSHMLVSLGRGINLTYSPAALRLINRLTGGNVFMARALCSRIVTAHRAADGHHVLAAHRVSAGEVRQAARALIALQGFGDTFLRWCNERERDVLHLIATARPRSLRAVRRALEGRWSAAAVNTAIKTVQSMQLTGYLRGRHRVAIPLMEDWTREHLDPTPQQVSRTRHRRLFHVSVGLGATALLGGVYFIGFHPQRLATPTASVGPCSYSADYPQRGAPGDEVTVYLFRDCAERPYLGMRLVSPHSAVRIKQADCAETAARCFAEASATLLDSSARDYGFDLVVDGGSALGFVVQKDPIAVARGILSRVLQIAAFVPTGLGLLFAFYRDILLGLRRLGGLKEPDEDAPPRPAALR